MTDTPGEFTITIRCQQGKGGWEISEIAPWSDASLGIEDRAKLVGVYTDILASAIKKLNIEQILSPDLWEQDGQFKVGLKVV